MSCLTAFALLLDPFKQARQGAKYIFLSSLDPDEVFDATCNLLSAWSWEHSCFMLETVLEIGVTTTFPVMNSNFALVLSSSKLGEVR